MDDQRHRNRQFDNWFDYIRIYWPLLVSLFFAFSTWASIQNDLKNLKRDVEYTSDKYIPIIELTEKRITILEENQKELLRILSRIEKKVE